METRIRIPSPVGTLEAMIVEGEILSMFFTGKADSSLKDVPLSAEDLETAERLKMQLDEYFAGVRREFDLPVALHGTEFQIAVWNAIRRIPYGEVRSYGEVAWMAGYPRAARAVGTACRKNALLLIVPCHRVVASDGLGGYGGRPDIKRAILRLEGNTAYEPTV
jgi:methylated-DNA-[protein]-cysteine S-methyltransferase